jgi:predicted membrane channel-forming protein YqfA (hemolysin III family)
MAGNFSQLCLLSLDERRVLLMGLAWVFSLLSGTYVFVAKRKNLAHKAMFAALMILALPELVYTMDNREILYFALTWLPCIGGMVVYSLGWPDPVPGHFGYHEVMHAMISLGGIFSILLQYELLHNFRPDECIFSVSDSLIDHIQMDVASVGKALAKLFDKLLARFMLSIDRGQMI